jgi:hypothetical protein
MLPYTIGVRIPFIICQQYPGFKTSCQADHQTGKEGIRNHHWKWSYPYNWTQFWSWTAQVGFGMTAGFSWVGFSIDDSTVHYIQGLRFTNTKNAISQLFSTTTTAMQIMLSTFCPRIRCNQWRIETEPSCLTNGAAHWNCYIYDPKLAVNPYVN